MATRSPHLQEPHLASYLQDQPKSCKHPSSHPDVEEAPGADAENLCHGSEPHGGHGGRIRTEHLFGVNSNSCRKRGNQCQNQPIGGTKPEDRTRYSHSDAFRATFGSFQYSIQPASVPESTTPVPGASVSGSRPPRPAPSLASRTTSDRHRRRAMPTAPGTSCRSARGPQAHDRRILAAIVGWEGALHHRTRPRRKGLCATASDAKPWSLASALP